MPINLPLTYSSPYALDAVETNDFASAGRNGGKIDDALIHARGVVGGTNG